MISQPQTIVQLTQTAANLPFSVGGPGHERVSQVADRFIHVVGLPQRPAIHVSILSRPDAHTGLGSGTQLDLAVADGLNYLTGNKLSARQLAVEVAQRGLRSAVGVHGYWQGGLIYERGVPDQSLSAINPIVCRLTIPDQWRIALLRPQIIAAEKVAGAMEANCFQAVERPKHESSEALANIIEKRLLPAVESADFAQFCESVRTYNYNSGMFFAEVQGGAYNGPQITACIQHLTKVGFPGVGQSSWGPTVFVFCEHEEAVLRLRSSLPAGWLLKELALPSRTGRDLRQLSKPDSA